MKSEISAGTSCVLVKDAGFCKGENSWFFKWLKDEGFSYYHCGSTTSGVGWVYINLTSKVYTGGKTGVSVTSVIANHAITIEEFMTIYQIYKKYEGLGLLRMNLQEQYCHKYDDMKGADFLVAFFRDNGITEEEIRLYSRWNAGGFGVSSRLVADNDGLEYAQKRVRSILEYRKLSAEDVLKNMCDTEKIPWTWPSAMKFQPLLRPPRSQKDVTGIYHCTYKGKSHLFGIGKEEVPITEDMSKNGLWSVYTWCD